MNKQKFLPPTRISCGHQFTIALTDSNELFVWGDNKNSKLGLEKSSESIWNPTLLPLSHFPGSLHDISCGSDFTLAVITSTGEDSGSLLGWGTNSSGQLTDPCEFLLPTQIPIPEKIARVSCGSDFSACISSQGHLYTWGRGTYGNLGHGSTDSYTQPHLVQSLIDQKILSVSCGSKHMLAVTLTFKLYTWGSGANGRLGHGDLAGTSSPKLVEALTNEKILSVTAGEGHSAAISTLGVVYTWGCGSYGRLGQGSEVDVYVPAIVDSFRGKRIYMVACGFRHCLGLSMHGEVFAWGSGNYGVTGLFDLKDLRNMLVPLKVQYLEGKKVTQVACGTWHSAAITSAGEVWTWGYHGHGRLGLGSDLRKDQAFPKQIPSTFIYGVTGGTRIVERITEITGTTFTKQKPAQSSWKISQISCCGQSSLALSSNGSLWVWGEGKSGCLGNGLTSDDQLFPVLCGNLNTIQILSIACGSSHCLAISLNEVYSWGNGKQGQLGTGVLSVCFIPKAIKFLSDKNSVSAACGEDFSLVLTENGEVYSFGNGDSGKLGHGNDAKQVFPKLVQGLGNVVLVNAGFSHAACVDRNGAIFTCGNGVYGKLANGSLENSLVFKKIHLKSVRKYTSVACGAYHTLMIDEEGELWAAGKKEIIGTRFDEPEPKLLEELRGRKVRLITAAEEHSIVILDDGESFAWGVNKYGKLGTGTETGQKTSPTKLDLPKNILQVSSKINHTLALTKTGEIFVWGCGSAGRLGTGSTVNIKTPKLLESKWIMAGKQGNNEEDMNRLDLMLSQIDSGAQIASFSEAIFVLQCEPEEYHIENIRTNQERILEKFNEILSGMRKCKEAENETLALINEFENRILQRTFELKLAQRDYLKVSIPAYLASKLTTIETLIWTLQQQPCYLTRLISTMQQRGAKDLPQTVKSVRLLFSSLSKSHKSRESLLYLTLLKSIISQEIDSSTTLDDLFTSSTSLSAQFLLTFFSRQYGSDLFTKILQKGVSEGLGMIQALGVTSFSISIKDLASKGYRKVTGSASTVLQDKRSKVSLDDGIEYIVRAVGNFVNGFSNLSGVLTYSVKVLLKHAFSKIMNKKWLGDEEINEKMTKALLRLVVAQVMVPAIITPEAEGLTANALSNEEREVFGFFAEVLKKIVQNSLYLGDHYRVLNGFIQKSHQSLIESIAACLEIEDSTQVDLTVSIFLSHFSRTDNFIQFPVNELVFIIIILIKYKKSIEIVIGRDRVFELLEQIGDIGALVSNTLENFKVNLKMYNKFLYENTDVAICTVCGVPMPKELAVVSNAYETIVRTISSDSSGYAEFFESVGRKMPGFNCENLEELADGLRKYAESVVSV